MKPYWKSSDGDIYHGHVMDVLKSLPDESVQMCVTSPPYWGLRDYGIEPQVWDGDKFCQHAFVGDKKQIATNNSDHKGKIVRKDGYKNSFRSGKSYIDQPQFSGQGKFCQCCNAWRGSLGLEPTPELYIKHVVQIFAEVKRVLRKDATCWINLGDSFQNKQLLGMPWRIAFALQDNGWWLRYDIIWSKCLSGGTYVYAKAKKGEMPMMIRDLARLKNVMLWNGKKWSYVNKITKQPRNGDEIELVLRSGERISCTPEHKWPLLNGKTLYAEDLKVGDVLDSTYLPEPFEPIEPTHLPDNTVGWFVGIYLAEGSRDTGGTIQISSHTSEVPRFLKVESLALQYGGTCCKHQTSKNGMTINIDSKVLSAVIDTYIAGHTAKDKHLTNACWQRSNYFLSSLLAGYLSGDGHRDDKNKRWRLGFTRNYYLENDIRILTARLCYNLTLKLSTANIGNKQYKTFRGSLRRGDTYKGHWNEKTKSEIIEIRKSRARYFYDIEMTDEPHLFTLASGVLTHNSNPMPESVTDRPTKAHEYMFLLTKSAKYYYDADAIREPLQESTKDRHRYGWNGNEERDYINGPQNHLSKYMGSETSKNASDRNKRTVWTIPTEPLKDQHFASFPSKLVEPCILAGCPKGGIVLEPFLGSGKTFLVAYKHGRRCIGIELNKKYLNEIAIPKIEKVRRQMRMFK